MSIFSYFRDLFCNVVLVCSALSSSVVATATGSVMTVSNPVTPKDKQRSLTERLMSVGPSNPRRVQVSWCMTRNYGVNKYLI